MPILDFIITVFCLIDDECKALPKPIRQRGFKPALSDSEVMTMEAVGEFLGIDTDGTFTAANVDERDVCPELMEKVHGLALGDKGFISPILQEKLKRQGTYLQTPVRDNMKEERPSWFLQWMKGTRRLIETVIGQLSERFHIEKVRARDLWHQTSRFWRKLLAHTICIKINVTMGNEPLQFERLVS